MLDEDPFCPSVSYHTSPQWLWGWVLRGRHGDTKSNNRGDLDPIPIGLLLPLDDGCDRRWVGCYPWSLSGRN